MSDIFSKQKFTISKRTFKVIKFKNFLYTFIILILIIPALFFLKNKIDFLENNFYISLLAIIIIVLLISFLERKHSEYWYNNYSYSLEEEGIILNSGLFKKNKIFIPYYIIQNVNITTGPILRKYNLANLDINTLSRDITIFYIDGELVNELKETITNRKENLRLEN